LKIKDDFAAKLQKNSAPIKIINHEVTNHKLNWFKKRKAKNKWKKRKKLFKQLNIVNSPDNSASRLKQ